MPKARSILIRMPNWLGDMVMASSFLEAVKAQYPGAVVDLIVRKEIAELAALLPPHGKNWIFSKAEYPGLRGVRKFGRLIRAGKKYDLFFCLPTSLSSAVMGRAINAKVSVGFRTTANRLLFRKTYPLPAYVHRVEEYVGLLSQFLKKYIAIIPVRLATGSVQKSESLVININSEASSRRLPRDKAVRMISLLRKKISNEIILVGSPKEKNFVDEVMALLPDKENIKNIAGETSLTELAGIFASAKCVLSTDSGPAHVANAVGTRTVVLFGAGDEHNTAPYNADNCVVIRLGKLPCEPCRKNTCTIYGIPECLLQLDDALITSTIIQLLS